MKNKFKNLKILNLRTLSHLKNYEKLNKISKIFLVEQKMIKYKRNYMIIIYPKNFRGEFQTSPPVMIFILIYLLTA